MLTFRYPLWHYSIQMCLDGSWPPAGQGTDLAISSRLLMAAQWRSVTFSRSGSWTSSPRSTSSLTRSTAPYWTALTGPKLEWSGRAPGWLEGGGGGDWPEGERAWLELTMSWAGS